MRLIWLLTSLLTPCPTLSAREYFQDSALDFLRRYGHHYNFFSRFFPNGTAEAPMNSRTRGIEEDYLTRDFRQFRTWETSSDMRNFSEKYYREDVDQNIEVYNNKFRYGPLPHERFLDISINEKTNSIQFYGWENNVPSGTQFGCSFVSPSDAFTLVSFERGFQNAVKENVLHTFVTCPIPSEFAPSNATEFRFHLVQGTTSSGHVLISNIVVKRPHQLERRMFNVSLSTQVDDWNEPMLIEWLTYHILAGIEHFYLFDITRTDWPVKGSAIEPFLLANIVTIIYFPFVPLKDDDHPFPATYLHAVHGTHAVEINIAMHRFGVYTKFLSLQDVDEFFCLSEDFLPRGEAWGYSNSLYIALESLRASQVAVAPGIMFDTLETGCLDEENYHHSKSLRRPALTTTCTITGKYFEELKVGHGKYFAVPAVYAKDIKFVSSPHRINHYWVVWTKPSHGGLFYHFNRFRYSGEGFAKGETILLKTFTLRALRNLFSLPA